MNESKTVKPLRDEPFVSSRFLGGTLRALILGALLFGLPVSAAFAKVGSAAPSHHIYLFRGFANIFSMGMDGIADKLQQQGYNVTLDNHIFWSTRAEEAAADYKAGRVRTIVIVGHSAGADAASEMAARLGDLGVPVKLVICLDPGWPAKAEGRVARYVDWYISGGLGSPLETSARYHGKLENHDLKNTDIGHFTIEKDAAMQKKIIDAIRGAIVSASAPRVAPATASTGTPAAQGNGATAAATPKQ